MEIKKARHGGNRTRHKTHDFLNMNQNIINEKKLQSPNYLFLELDELTQEAAVLVGLQNASAIAFATSVIFHHALEFLAM